MVRAQRACGAAPRQAVRLSGLAGPEGRGRRCVHYVLAHRELPAAVFRHPEHIVGQLRTDEAREVLEHCWYGAARTCWDFSGGVPIRADPRPSGNRARPLVKIRAGQAMRRACVVLEMPAPVIPAEAYFVAVVEPAQRAPDPTGLGQSPLGARCFTLEAGAPDGPATFLCEWRSDGTHANLAGGPRPGARVFLEAIGRRLHDEAGASPGALHVELDGEPRVVLLPGMLDLEGLTAGDLLDDLAGSDLDPEVVRIAYHADPEHMIRRPWQVEALCAVGTPIVPALETSLSDEHRRLWAALLLQLLDPDT